MAKRSEPGFTGLASGICTLEEYRAAVGVESTRDIRVIPAVYRPDVGHMSGVFLHGVANIGRKVEPHATH
jgi:hypothetical protein